MELKGFFPGISMTPDYHGFFRAKAQCASCRYQIKSNEESKMPMYPEVMLVPMREELTRAGVEELRSAEEVASVLDRNEGTVKARSYTAPFPPSSPSIGILRDGKLVYFMQRSDIEIRPAQEIAGLLVDAFKKYCARASV